MANIRFIRTYEFYGDEWCDIVYEKDGYATRCYQYPVAEMPKTASKWLEGKQGTEQYDRVFNRVETIYR